jgi:four helix bundle protein
MSKSYKDLEIYQIAHKLAVDIHKMTLQLPKFEMFEEGSQIRKSSRGISSCIVEGFGRRRYKNDFVRFLVFAQASNDETKEHLSLLSETGSLENQEQYKNFVSEYEKLGRKIYNFLKAVELGHLTE